MINLIPTEEKKEIRNDFLGRFLSIFFIMVSIVLLITSITMLPSLIFSYGKKGSIDKKVEFQKNEIMPAIDKEAQTAILDLNNRLGSIEKSMNDKYIFSQNIVTEIVSKKTSGIKVSGIFYENDKLKGKTIVVNGIAISREQLLLFRRSFEDSGAFRSVDLPISNFVKGHDIEFSLNLIAT